MHSFEVICLVICLRCLIAVSGETISQQESTNSTSAEDRRDVHWKKPPRKRGTFSLSYGSSFPPGWHFANGKSLSFKKDPTPTFVEKYVPVPVHVKVPVDRPVPVHIPKLVAVEKPVPVPIKVNVPQPYPVYKRVAVPVKVPVDRPVPVQVLKPYPVYVEKQVPYPVDKPVPVPVKVPVDRPYPVYVTVEKPTEKPASMKWQPEKLYTVPTGKSMLWFEKPETSMSMKEETDNEKLASSWLELPEQSESEITWPGENIELEIRK